MSHSTFRDKNKQVYVSVSFMQGHLVGIRDLVSRSDQSAHLGVNILCTWWIGVVLNFCHMAFTECHNTVQLDTE